MFSLIITIISIALVAALALATLYYGGAAFNQGRADAKAAQILSQGQQLIAAADLYRANHGVFPPNKQALLDGGYLRSVPMAQGGTVDTAWAEDQEWGMPLPGVPVFVLPATEAAPCQRVNFRSFHMNGILAEVNESIAAQCYGPSTNTSALKTVVSKSGTYLSALAEAVSASNPALDPTVPLTPVDFGAVQTELPDPEADDGTWTSPPEASVPENGGNPAASIEVAVEAPGATLSAGPMPKWGTGYMYDFRWVDVYSDSPITSVSYTQSDQGFSTEHFYDCIGETSCSFIVYFEPYQDPQTGYNSGHTETATFTFTSGTETVEMDFEGYVEYIY